LTSKTFDNGTICASEQSVIVVDEIYDRVKQEFRERGAHFLDETARQRVREALLKDGRLNPAIVGQSVATIAELVEIDVPAGAKVLIGEAEIVGPEEPFAYEKLSPVLAMYRADNYEDAVAKASALVEFGGRGHTSVLYVDPTRRDRIDYFESRVATSRMLLNTPSSQGAIGDLYNFHLDPSLTLGCGSWGGNSISDNVGPQHLLNIKTVAERRENMLWFRVPPEVYFKRGCLPVALQELAGKRRVFIVTDKPLYDLGLVAPVAKVLDELNIAHRVFYDVKPDPALSVINQGVAAMNDFQPDAIIALGGGSPIDAAKVMWLLYEHPEIEFEGVAMRFMDIRKRVYELPELGQKAPLIAIPTTSGTGSEVTPFAVVTDDRTGVKYPLADYALTPKMAIVDPDLVMGMPKKLTAFGGIDALTHALEAYVSVMATEFTNGLALEAIDLLVNYLPRAYQNGTADPEAREKVHYAATIAGMAFANAFLGICHSLAHKLGSTFHVPHGLANALMISHVIRYNATDAPFKQAIFPQYRFPNAKARYARIADYLGLGGSNPDDKVERLIAAIEDLKRQVDIPLTVKEVLSDHDQEFYEEVEAMADQAFDDQCTGANPRYPLIADLKELYVLAYRGCRLDAALYHQTDPTPAS